MPLVGFTVFKDKILNGTKTQTIRKMRKHPIKIGEKLYLYWHTRQKDCEKLGEAICIEVMTIQIHSEYWLRKQRPLIFKFIGPENLPWKGLQSDEVLEIAKRDGFNGEDDFLAFFVNHYPLPEVFQVIRWQTPVCNNKSDEKSTINEKPNCFKNFDNGLSWRRGGPICDDCKFKVECEKESPKREVKDCRSAEEVYSQEVANRKYIAQTNYETYMNSYGP